MRSKKELNELLTSLPPSPFEDKDESDYQDINQLDKNLSQYVKVFDYCSKNLDIDIEHVNSRLSLLQTYITSIDTQLVNLKNFIKNAQNDGQKVRLYKLLNESLEIGVKYHELYLRALDIKYKYRKEQDDFNYKKVDYQSIRYPKSQQEDASKDGVTLSDLMEFMKSVERQIKESQSVSSNPASNNNHIANIFKELNEDPDYKI